MAVVPENQTSAAWQKADSTSQLGAALVSDMRALRRQLVPSGAPPSRAPAPCDYAFTRLLGLLDALRAHSVEAALGVPPNASALRLNASALWGVPAGGWNASCSSLACARSTYAAFLAPRFWQTRTATEAAQHRAESPLRRQHGRVRHAPLPPPPQGPDGRGVMLLHGVRPLPPFISMISGEDMLNDCPSCGARAAFAFWHHAKFAVDWLNLLPASIPKIGIGNSAFPGSRTNQMLEQHQQDVLYQVQIPPFLPIPVCQIIIFVIWLLLFLGCQCTCGALELLFWWIMNPWWDMVMLGFFAYANALWQSCDGCGLKNCPRSGTGSGGQCSCVDGKPTCRA